ncbi:protein NPAT isoform X2 [Esox lucius]|uniref:Protein NPAT C-terminal domain-containing protein n=1 Tax=Esox lucius TaxID=8010 RepID=A0A3P9AEU8_ESOLU|nr:protein NPAT isoform X2 [Esox lucius]
MLLPSDIARLVLGYLQQEGLCSTSQAFIFESPNLKEYAEHSSDDGTIPACVFSLFGKNLTTILNEYVAVKAKETCEETQIPAMMTSLWKKLDFTLNQIKSMQNSPAVIQNQRLRTRNGIVNMRGRQRVLSSVSSPSPGCLPLSAPLPDQGSTSQFHTPQMILGRTTQVCYTSPQTRPSPICSTPTQIQDGEPLLINVNRETPLQIMVPENRLTQGPLSPGRRKWRRGGGSGGSSGTGRANMAACHLTSEPQNEEVVTENFPQMVIQNARERILNDKSLQEKLAENINKILASDGSPQASKASCSTVEPDQSIDEILGLQGEIHMSNDAIQDILEQTESDPAFQALFDLFDYGKSKTIEDNEQGVVILRNSTTESEVTGAGFIDSPDTGDAGTGPEHSTCTPETTTRAAKSSQEPKSKKTRKSAPPVSSTSKATTGISTRGSRRGASTTQLSASNDKPASVASSAAKVSQRPDDASNFIQDGSGMDLDEPLNSPPHDTMSSNDVFECHESTPTSTGLTRTNVQMSEVNTSSSNNRTVSAERKQLENNNALTASNGIVLDNQDALLNSPPALVISIPMLDESSKVPANVSNVPCSIVTPPRSGRISQTQPQALPSMAVPAAVPTTAPSALPTLVHNPTGKDVDPSKIVALKIIISDEQEERCSESALNQAVSSITGDPIPTIFLSSPAKSPAKAQSLSASMAPEETVQAVSSLQRTEVLQPVETNPLRGKAGPVAALTGTSSAWTQPTTGYYIQLPFDSATSTYGSATNSYFLVTDTTATDPNSNKVMLPSGAPQGPAVPVTSYALATPPRYSPGSRLIVPSQVQSMLQNVVVPVSVVGQNNAGQFSVVSNQLLAMPSPASAQQPAAVKAKPKLAPKDNTVSCQTRAPGLNEMTKQVHPPSCESTEQQNAVVGSSPSHRRMLCFDGSAGETSTPTRTASSFKAPAAATHVVPSVQQAEKESPKLAPAKPNVLGSSRPKRRIETVRCMDNTQTTWTGTETEKSSAVRKQKEAVKNTLSKRDGDQSPSQTSRSESSGSQKTDVSQLESSNSSQVRTPQSAEKKDDGGKELGNAQSSRTTSSDHRLRSGSRKEKEKEDASTQDPMEDCPVEGREGQGEKKNCPQNPPHVAANKENELEVGRKERQPTLAPREFSPTQVGSQAPVPQVGSSKTPSKTSPLTKQAAEMLHDIQGIKPPSTPPKKSGTSCPELPLPRTPGPLQEASSDCHRTPARQRPGRDGEGTPRRVVPPATPDLPSCSPASEAGSENSINMAAHTLMILSRAAIARTGTPLKDSLRQEGVGAVTPVASKSNKRKQPESLDSPTAKKDHSVSSGSKKKAKKQKKLLDSFPDDLDVDKFLSSLHYDE